MDRQRLGTGRLVLRACLLLLGCGSSSQQPEATPTSSGGSRAVAGSDAGVPRGPADAASTTDATTPPTPKDAETPVAQADAAQHMTTFTNTCGGVTCPAPTTCDTTSGTGICVCPAGQHFTDVGGTSSPCVAIADDDAGDDDAGS